MTLNHHPSDALLVAYGAGTLSEGLSLAVTTHLTLCPHCRAAAQRINQIGGALLDAEPGLALADDALARTMARLGPVPAAPAPQQIRVALGLPAPLAPYIGSDIRWQSLAPGVRRVELLRRTSRGGAAQLLRIAPGTALPHHGHGGLELTLVLSGSFADETGRYGPGDLAEVDQDTRHQPVSDTHEDCICLIATDAPLRFTGILGRLVQPFIGM